MGGLAPAGQSAGVDESDGAGARAVPCLKNVPPRLSHLDDRAAHAQREGHLADRDHQLTQRWGYLAHG